MNNPVWGFENVSSVGNIVMSTTVHGFPNFTVLTYNRTDEKNSIFFTPQFLGYFVDLYFHGIVHYQFVHLTDLVELARRKFTSADHSREYFEPPSFHLNMAQYRFIRDRFSFVTIITRPVLTNNKLLNMA